MGKSHWQINHAMTEIHGSLPAQIFAAFVARLESDESIEVSLIDGLKPLIVPGALLDRKQILRSVTLAATDSKQIER